MTIFPLIFIHIIHKFQTTPPRFMNYIGWLTKDKKEGPLVWDPS